jgi:hypothetical protein
MILMNPAMTVDPAKFKSIGYRQYLTKAYLTAHHP